MKLSVDIRKNTYYDSVTLMLITKEIKKMEGISEVIVGMGTELNKELAENLNLWNKDIAGITPNDFFVAAICEEDAIKKAVKKVDELLNSKKDNSSEDIKVKTFSAAVKQMPDANMAVISLPGKYAADEARKALENNMHVMLFSDNVTMEEELELKTMGKEKGLLVMGPDCGTAIINHVPLCFANVIRKGNIGIVGASGTGTQEVTVLIDKLGGGISQVIGTGGRDLKSQIGGIMMLEGFKALIMDDETKVIVLISKPPAQEVAEKILDMVKLANKPVVVNFIGGDRAEVERCGAVACVSLEDAARKAVALSRGEKAEDVTGFTQDEKEIDTIVDRECSKLGMGQKYLRALYTGGTLADEAMKLLAKEGLKVYSNIPLSPELKLENIHKSKEHTCIDLGDDDFTLGKPHPMIDPMGRIERLSVEAEGSETAVILMDFVLGYGSNMDPAGEMIPGILEAKNAMRSQGRDLCIIGYILGTDKDPQNYMEQSDKLKEAGVVLMPSNAQAVKLASRILKRINNLEGGV